MLGFSQFAQFVLLPVFLNFASMDYYESELVFGVEISNELHLFSCGVDFSKTFLEHEFN